MPRLRLLTVLLAVPVLFPLGCETTTEPTDATSALGDPLPATGAPATAAPAPSTPARDDLLDLDYAAFDQTPASGWRVLATSGQFREAGRLIDAYMARHTELSPDQRGILAFHAGQMYAFAGDYAPAKARFRQAKTPSDRPDLPIRWNAYVEATIAFLDDDMNGLVAARKEIAEGPSVNGIKPNLNFVDSFIENFGESYSLAYTQAKAPMAS